MFHCKIHQEMLIYVGCGPLPVTVTTRIITFLVGIHINLDFPLLLGGCHTQDIWSQYGKLYRTGQMRCQTWAVIQSFTELPQHAFQANFPNFDVQHLAREIYWPEGATEKAIEYDLETKHIFIIKYDIIIQNSAESVVHFCPALLSDFAFSGCSENV